MSRRSTPLIAIGAAALAIGALAAFAGIAHDRPGRVEAGAGAAAPAAGAAALTIPEGKQAIAVALDPVAGAAGVARKGSSIDVFAAVAKKDDKGNAARMLLQKIEVLDIQSAGPIGGAANAATPNTTVFVLAVTPIQAEKLVYHAAFSRLWFSVMPDGQGPVPPTPGVNSANELEAA